MNPFGNVGEDVLYFKDFLFTVFMLIPFYAFMIYFLIGVAPPLKRLAVRAIENFDIQKTFHNGVKEQGEQK